MGNVEESKLQQSYATQWPKCISYILYAYINQHNLAKQCFMKNKMHLHVSVQEAISVFIHNSWNKQSK